MLLHSSSLLSIFPLAPSCCPLSLPSYCPSPSHFHSILSFPLSPLISPLPPPPTSMASAFPLISPTVWTEAEGKQLCLQRSQPSGVVFQGACGPHSMYLQRRWPFEHFFYIHSHVDVKIDIIVSYVIWTSQQLAQKDLPIGFLPHRHAHCQNKIWSRHGRSRLHSVSFPSESLSGLR